MIVNNAVKTWVLSIFSVLLVVSAAVKIINELWAENNQTSSRVGARPTLVL